MGDCQGGLNDVLVVDDNPGDRRFIREALSTAQTDLTIHTVRARDEALDAVHQRGEYEDGPDLDVILLDWRLSQTTSEDVLAAAKDGGSPIPVVVMTSSKTEMDETRSLHSKADMLTEKPTDPDGYIEMLCALQTEN